MPNLDETKKLLLTAVKVLAIVLLAAYWIWALYPAPDQDIDWDYTVINAMEEKNIPVYKLSGFAYLQSATAFSNREISGNDNPGQFIKNTTSGMILVRMIERNDGLWREFNFLPADQSQEIQRYSEVYNPPPSFFAYTAKLNDEGYYYYGKDYGLCIFGVMFAVLVFVFVFPKRESCGFCCRGKNVS
jgi:hypothetical protein